MKFLSGTEQCASFVLQSLLPYFGRGGPPPPYSVICYTRLTSLEKKNQINCNFLYIYVFYRNCLMLVVKPILILPNVFEFEMLIVTQHIISKEHNFEYNHGLHHTLY